MISGRRGTGKSTGWKICVAEGANFIVCTRTKALARTLPGRIVPPTLSNKLPVPEVLIDGDEDSPLFKFGDGCVKVVSLGAVSSIRDTGVSVDGKQADAILLDEFRPTNGRYLRNEPLLLDDLAATVGRSGKIPPVIVIGNPESNKNPYSYLWRVNTLAEGIYTHNGATTEVVGTSDCRDCFGRKIGTDATASVYAEHLTKGGDVITVDGHSIRVRQIGGWLYVGLADREGVRLMYKGTYTPTALTSAGTKFILECKQSMYDDKVVFDSFEAQMIFYELLRARDL